MTGSGSGNIAIAMEDSFRTLPDIPTWFKPGEALEDTDATLDRQLIDNPQANDPRGDSKIEGNRRGTFSLSFTFAGTNWHQLVFPASNPTGLGQSGGKPAPTATIYEEVVTPGGTQQRFLAGAAVESMTINYTEGEQVTVDLSFIYFDEPEVGGTHGSAPTESDIQSPTKSDIVTGDGFDFQVAGASIDNLQSTSIEVTGLATERTQQSQFPSDVVVGDYDQSISVDAILSDNTLRERTYGSDTAVEPVSTVEETTATATATSRAGTTTTYNFSRVMPATFGWSNVTGSEQASTPTELDFVDMTVA